MPTPATSAIAALISPVLMTDPPSPLIYTRLLRRRLELAGRLRPVEAERIELAELMQEALLWRHRDQRPRRRQQHRLTQLTVPVAEGELLALEAGDAELGAADIGVHAGIVGLVRARRGLGDAAHRQPSGVVALGHPAAGELG